MCDFSKGIRLCTCNDPSTIVHHKKKRIKAGWIEYKWQLKRYACESEGMAVGLYEFPVSQLNDTLTAQQVLEALQAGNAFDFAYQPAEGDNLLIHTEHAEAYRYMEFIYRNGQWAEGHYSPFDHELDPLRKGKVLPR